MDDCPWGRKFKRVPLKRDCGKNGFCIWEINRWHPEIRRNKQEEK
jgi:hypothetical protein